MTLHEQVTDILASAVEAQECAGISVLVRRCGEEMLYTQAGMSDVASGRLIHRDSIFRLYSQSKPITAAAVMLLASAGVVGLAAFPNSAIPEALGRGAVLWGNLLLALALPLLAVVVKWFRH